MSAIVALDAYVPRLRLARAAIVDAVGWLGAPTSAGHRSLAFWDEDSVTMAVAAGRACLASGVAAEEVRSFDFATTTPPFALRQNASIIHAAQRLPARCSCQDVTGTRRAALLSLHRLLRTQESGLVCAADCPVSAPGTSDEATNGDGAAAVATGAGEGLLTYHGGCSIADPMIEAYRMPGRTFTEAWEERWVREEGWLKLVPQAIAGALADAGLASAAVSHLIVSAPNTRLAAAIATVAGLKNAVPVDNLMTAIGDTGTAHTLLMLTAALPHLRAGEIIVVAELGQGASALVLEATSKAAAARPRLREDLDRGIEETAYAKLAAFTGVLAQHLGPRGRTAIQPALSTAHRHDQTLLGFVAGRCRKSGAVRFPKSPDISGHDTQEPWPLADRAGRIRTRTADLLAYSPHPPSCYGLVDIEGGGRLMMDFTDADAPALAPGDDVRFVFRLKDVDPATGFRRYFWKAATPIGTFKE